jgi:dimethylargininase
MEQHAAYCRALETCGLKVTVLPADPAFPDSPFVEDVVVATRNVAILTRPGAPAREGEVASIRDAVKKFFKNIQEITAPGTLDGGDVCEAGSQFFIGISQRTNEEGARQLSEFLTGDGFTTTTVDIREWKSVLHLKSAVAYLGEKNLVVWDEFADMEPFHGFKHIRISAQERYAANCLRVHDYVLVATGFPATAEAIRKTGYNLLPLDVSEFRKMDGGLSCLSIRF